VDVQESRAVEGGRRAVGAGGGDEKDGAGRGASKHADQYGQTDVDVFEARRLKEAEELFVQVVETGLRMLGAEHPDTLTSMGNLALTFSKQGRLKEAEELEVQLMEMRKRVLDAEHTDTLINMNKVAYTLRNRVSRRRLSR